MMRQSATLYQSNELIVDSGFPSVGKMMVKLKVTTYIAL